jgi:hypothetical protein
VKELALMVLERLAEGPQQVEKDVEILRNDEPV